MDLSDCIGTTKQLAENSGSYLFCNRHKTFSIEFSAAC